MSPSTLSHIKGEIRKFSNLYEVLIKMWNGDVPHDNGATYPETIQVSVILHNMAFNSPNSVGYSHEREVKELYSLRDVLRALNEYHNENYMIHQAFKEVDMIIDGNAMSEDAY